MIEPVFFRVGKDVSVVCEINISPNAQLFPTPLLLTDTTARGLEKYIRQY